MKVVQALGWYFPDKLGGTEIYVRGLCRRLKESGCLVTVAAPETGIDRPRTYEYDGVEVFRYPIPNSPTKLEVQSRVAVRGTEHFHDWIAAQQPDVFHCHTFVTGLGVHELAAAKGIGSRVIVTTHSSALGWICQRGTLMRYGETKCDGLTLPRRCSACELQHRGLPKGLTSLTAKVPSRLSRWMHKRSGKLSTMFGMPALIEDNMALQRRMLDLVDAFVVLTCEAARIVALNGCPPGKLSVNRLGISQSDVERKAGPESRPTMAPITIGYLGRYDQIKGVIDFASAVSRLPKDTPIRIEFRGPIQSDEDRHVVDAMKSLLGDDPRVLINGAVPPEEVTALLGRWDVACFPSRCLEGGPTAAIEAIAVGTPVVGTNIGGLAELVENGVNGALVEPADVNALSGLILRMAKHPAETIDRWRLSLGDARTMDDIAVDYLELYKKILTRILSPLSALAGRR